MSNHYSEQSDRSNKSGAFKNKTFTKIRIALTIMFFIGISAYNITLRDSFGDSDTEIFYTWVGFAVITLFFHTGLFIIQWICEDREEAKSKKALKAQAIAFRDKYNQQSAWELFKMPLHYTVCGDMFPVADRVFGAFNNVCVGSSAYHLSRCRYARGPQISKFKAVSLGLHPCKVCCPPAADDEWYRAYAEWAKEAQRLGVKLTIIDDIITIDEIR